MNNAELVEQDVFRDSFASKLAETQTQLMVLARLVDREEESGNTGSFAQELAEENEKLKAENFRLKQQVGEWELFRQSRTYRLNKKYAAIYESKALGPIAIFARNAAKRTINLFRRNS